MVVNRRDPSLCRPMRSGRAACSATAAFEALFVVSVNNFHVPIIICRPVACFEFCDADKAGNAIRVWFTDDRSETRCGEHCPVQPFLICCFVYVERVYARVVNSIGRFFFTCGCAKRTLDVEFSAAPMLRKCFKQHA